MKWNLFLLLISFSFSLTSDNFADTLMSEAGHAYFRGLKFTSNLQSQIFCFRHTRLDTANYSCPNERSHAMVQHRCECYLPHGIFGRWFSPGYMCMSTVFLVSFWESMFLIKESPMIKTDSGWARDLALFLGWDLVDSFSLSTVLSSSVAALILYTDGLSNLVRLPRRTKQIVRLDG